jgi:nicotinamidase-related amidase
LIVIDYTNDFIAVDGLLSCGEPALKIEDNVYELIDVFLKNDNVVIFAVDAHYKDDKTHPENMMFKEHNIVGTIGRELYGKVQEIYEENAASEDVFYIDKLRYTSFSSPSTTYVADKFGKQWDDVVMREYLRRLNLEPFDIDKEYISPKDSRLFEILESKKIKKLNLCGVCTDLCVMHTAMDAYNLGFETIVHERSVQSYHKKGHEFALRYFSRVLGSDICYMKPQTLYL